MKHLYRSEKNKVWAGILGGIGEYLEVDPVLIRVIFVFLMIITGVFPGIIAYFICLFIVPQRPIQSKVEEESK